MTKRKAGEEKSSKAGKGGRVRVAGGRMGVNGWVVTVGSVGVGMGRCGRSVGFQEGVEYNRVGNWDLAWGSLTKREAGEEKR